MTALLAFAVMPTSLYFGMAPEYPKCLANRRSHMTRASRNELSAGNGVLSDSQEPRRQALADASPVDGSNGRLHHIVIAGWVQTAVSCSG